jgi:anti-anti-sigma factor
VKEGFFSTKVQDGVHILKFNLAEVLDAYEIEHMGDDIYRYLEPVESPRVLLDFAMVKHLSSAALGMLLALRGVIEGGGGRLGLINVRPDVQAIFEMTRLDMIISIYANTDDAVKKVAA